MYTRNIYQVRRVRTRHPPPRTRGCAACARVDAWTHGRAPYVRARTHGFTAHTAAFPAPHPHPPPAARARTPHPTHPQTIRVTDERRVLHLARGARLSALGAHSAAVPVPPLRIYALRAVLAPRRRSRWRCSCCRPSTAYATPTYGPCRNMDRARNQERAGGTSGAHARGKGEVVAWRWRSCVAWAWGGVAGCWRRAALRRLLAEVCVEALGLARGGGGTHG
jgi:hypothetical protein